MIKKIYILVILVSIIGISCQKQETKSIEQLENNKILNAAGEEYFFNPADYQTGRMVPTKKMIKNTTGDIIKGAILVWFPTGGLRVYDSEKNDPYFELVETKLKLKFKTSDEKLYISDDGVNWGKVTVRLIDNNPPKPKDPKEAEVIKILYLECPWFKGEYELLDTPG